MKVNIFCIFFGFITACGGHNLSSLTTIVGQDDRKAGVPNGYEATVGQIEMSGVPMCTGFISDKKIITASHCFFAGMPLSVYVFRAFDGTVYPITGIYDINDKADIIQFAANRLPDGMSKAEPNLGDEFTIVSFSNGPVHMNSKTLALSPKTGILLHEADTEFAASGSPLLQAGKVVGVHIGGVKKDQINIATLLTKAEDVTEIMGGIDFKAESLSDFLKAISVTIRVHPYLKVLFATVVSDDTSLDQGEALHKELIDQFARGKRAQEHVALRQKILSDALIGEWGSSTEPSYLTLKEDGTGIVQGTADDGTKVEFPFTWNMSWSSGVPVVTKNEYGRESITGVVDVKAPEGSLAISIDGEAAQCKITLLGLQPTGQGFSYQMKLINEEGERHLLSKKLLP